MTLDRLSLATLAERHAADPTIPITGPAMRPESIGIVHLGIGAFHRAHQAVFTELAAAQTGQKHWGILGVTLRSRGVVDQLVPQDGLYEVFEKGADSSALSIVGSVLDVAFARDDTERVMAAMAASTTHIISLTITEKGYRATAGGRLDRDDPELAADVAALIADADDTVEHAPSRTAIGLLVRGIAARARAANHQPRPVTVVCCDNIVGNGEFVQALVHDFLTLADAHAAGLAATGDAQTAEDVRAWITANVTFPSTMVDRIVPATTEAHRLEASATLGLRDEGLVVAEPFRQWVIEDNFAGPRPAWEQVGATFTPDVTPFEQAKLRMLNGTHSLLAYLGSLFDLRTMADAVTDARLAPIAREFLLDEVASTLVAPDGLDLTSYAESLLERFANPNTGHTTIQVAMDGSQKLPIRLFGTIADCLRAGLVPKRAAQAFAAWIVFVARGRSASGAELMLDDPRAAELADATGRGGTPRAATDLVAAVYALPDFVPSEITHNDKFTAVVVDAVNTLQHELEGTAQ